MFEHLNSKGGKDTLLFAGQGIQKKWQMKRPLHFSFYKTSISDIIIGK
ncbi:DUF4113 domain-containing protein [Enterobacter mori]